MFSPRNFLRRCVVGTVFCLVASTSLLPAQTAATVSVNAASPLTTIPPAAFGVNTACWNAYMADAPVPNLYRQAGITALRYPGGSTSDVYHWQTNSATANSGQYVNPNDGFDTFMTVAQAAGAQPVITVNYGSNPAGTAGADPSEAAGWVDYANNVKKYGVKYWEVGNEVYGNKEYGGNWETDLHADQSPTAYGKNVVLFSQAMKVKDPTIKVGAVLITPGGFPDGQSPDWNTNVLANCGAAIDFVIIHPYAQDPGNESDAGLLATPATYATKVAKLRSLITQYCGANAANVQICVTETNSVSYNPGKQTLSLVNALFLADGVTTWLENGVANLDWWASHNGPSYGNASGSLYGTATYGDYGLFSVGGGPEPAAETPFPAYYGFEVLAKLGVPGDQYVSTASSQALLTTHAVRQANGSLALLLVNKDPSNSYAASVSVSGYTPAGGSTDYFYGQNSASVSSATGAAGSSFTRTVSPYSLTVVVMRPNGSNSTPTPTPVPTPTATPVPTPTPTPIPTATPTPKPTATPTATPTPAPTPVPTGGYLVTYSVTSQWNNGFVASVTIQNNTAATVNGWTLQWTFPGSQAITNAWSGIYTQNGNAVVFKNVDYDATIAPGGSITLGFQASYGGNNTNPLQFSFNGVTSGAPTPTPAPTATPTPTPAPTATPKPTATPTPAPTPTVPPKPTVTPTPTPTPSPTATPVPGAGYQVTYAVSSQWNNGFNVNVTIQNNGTAAVNGWSVRWTYSGNQVIANAWNGNATQSGQTVTVTNMPYNAAIPAGGSVSFGFQASYGGTNANPTVFVVNGTGATTAAALATPRTLSVVSVAADAPQAYPAQNIAGDFLLTRTGGDLSRPLTVAVVLGGNARSGTDYAPITSIQTIRAGKTSKRITLTGLDRADASGGKKTVKLAVQPSDDYHVGDLAAAKVKIRFTP